MKISILIPTYKNKKILINNLRHNWSFLKDHQIIIINDDPTKSIKEYLKEFPKIILIENNKNLGFGQTINKGIKRALGQYIFLLNNDVVLENKSFEKGLVYFKKNKKLFAVSFALREKDQKIVGKNKIFWRQGMFFNKGVNKLTFGVNAWAEGGACLIDKNKFLELGGFDPLFSPFYWEDIDLSYQAWKRGYQILFDPQILVNHFHETTISKYYDQSYIKKTAYRNQFIFIWKNITDQFYIFQHIVFLVPNLIKNTFRGEKEFFIGFIKALPYILAILRQRKRVKFKQKLTDRKIFSLF